VRNAWFGCHQLTPGTLVGQWTRPFTLWGYSGSHSRLLLRSVKYDPSTDPDQYPDDEDAEGVPAPDAWPRTRIDILCKLVDAVCLRQIGFPSLRIQVAEPERAAAVLAGLPQAWPSGGSRRDPDDRVLELIGPDGLADHVVCQAVGFHEDDGEYWDPSPFTDDLTDGRGSPWRRSLLGGGPDGSMDCRYASVEDLVRAVRAGQTHQPTGDTGRFLYVVMSRAYDHQGQEIGRPTAGPAHLHRAAAEQQLADLGGPDVRMGTGAGLLRFEHWIDTVPIDL
jgi:hypothetical protein